MDPPSVREDNLLRRHPLSFILSRRAERADNPYRQQTTNTPLLPLIRMKYHHPDNTVETAVTYNRTREGPNSFLVYYKNAARFVFTPKEVGACFGVARFTPSVNSIREWCYEMVKEYGSQEDKEDENYKKYIEKHGFGPEVHEEPNESTKMVT